MYNYTIEYMFVVIMSNYGVEGESESAKKQAKSLIEFSQ